MADRTNTNSLQNEQQTVEPQNSSIINYPIELVTDGMISDNTVSYSKAPKTSMSYIENMHNDVTGELRTRSEILDFPVSLPSSPSSVIFDDGGNTPGAGISITRTRRLLVQCGADIVTFDPYSTSPTAVTTYTGISTGGYRLRYDKYQGRIIYASLNQSLGYIYSPASAWGTITGLTGIATKTDLVSVGFYGMVWAASSQDNTCTLYNSDPITTNLESATYSTSSTLGAAATKINFSNGDTITAFAKTQNSLFLFSQNEIRRVFAPGQYDTTAVIQMGTPSQEAVVKTRIGYFFYNSNGVFFLNPSSDYSMPTADEVSFPIRDYIRRNVSSYSDVIGWSDQDCVYYQLTTKIENNQIRTIVVRYNFVLKKWSVYTYMDKRFASSYSQLTAEDITTSGSQMNPITYLVGAKGVGSQYFVSVMNDNLIEKGTTPTGWYNLQNVDSKPDNTYINDQTAIRGTGIFFDAQTQWLDFDMPHVYKRITGFYTSHLLGSGAVMYIKYDNDENPWVEVMNLDDKFVTTSRQTQTELFYRCKIRIAGNGRGTIKQLFNMGFFLVDFQGYDEA